MTAIYSRMVEQTREAGAIGAQFIVWSEGSFDWDPQVEDRLNLAGSWGSSAKTILSLLAVKPV